jgi:phytanoyl-CoA hydroxylase
MNTLQIEHYQREGWAVVEGVFTTDQCQELVTHMLDLHAGKKSLEGFAPRAADQLQRTHNQHWYDPTAREWLIAPPLREPLIQCLGDEPDGIQTMYFWVGSEQGRHQDQYYLPGCMSAWIALMDVDEDNGAMWVQPGSHKGRLLTGSDFAEGGEFHEWDYNAAVDELFTRNDLPEIPVCVQQGDVVFFDGVLVHRGGPIGQPGSYRHSLANHYIAHGFSDWPHVRWPRVSFDGSQRFTD